MTAPLRFLHVSPSFGVGGAQIRFAQLANRFARHGNMPIEHLICAMDGRHQVLSKLDPGVSHRIIEPPASRTSMFGTVGAFHRTLKQQAPDLLLTYNWGTIECSIANLALGLPEVHFEDGFGPEEAAGQLWRRVLTRRLVLRWRAMTVLPSKVLLEHAKQLWRLPPSRIAYIPNGIDCERFDARDATRNDDSSVVIGTVAGLRKEKNLGRLLEAFAQLPKTPRTSLVIAGEGLERPALEAMAASLGIAERVDFAGYCAQPETVVAGFDIFALSSDTEQMPISLVEAMASSLPVAAVDVGDVASMVAEENKAEITPPDATCLSKALAGLVTDPARRRQLGEANRRRALELFDEGLMVQRYTTLFQQVMERADGPVMSEKTAENR